MLEVHQCLLAVVALGTCGAAGEGGKDIVVVHGSNLVGVAIPGLKAVAADHLVGTDHAAQADGGQVCVLAFRLHLVHRAIQFQRRKKISAIQQRELVVDRQL